MPTGDQLLNEVLSGGDDNAAQALLNAFFEGYPVERLRELLNCKVDKVAKAGAWIASELGSGAAPLLENFELLLDHPSRYVRFFILDPVLVCAGPNDGHLLGHAVRLLRDEDEAVRWKVWVFLTKASPIQLEIASSNVEDEHIAKLVHWLAKLKPDAGDEVCERAGSADELERMISAVGAARLFEDVPKLLEDASRSLDVQVASFAVEQLKVLRLGK